MILLYIISNFRKTKWRLNYCCKIHFLCCSKNEFRQHLQRMTQMHEWQSYFSFDHAVDLDSISFKDGCTPDKTLLLLLQKGQDTWM